MGDVNKSSDFQFNFNQIMMVLITIITTIVT